MIGSGPAGVSAAHALVGKGRRVIMLDAGPRLEPERVELIEFVLVRNRAVEIEAKAPRKNTQPHRRLTIPRLQPKRTR